MVICRFLWEIASIIADVLKAAEPAIITKGEKKGEISKNRAKAPKEVIERAKSRVKALLDRFMLYPELDLDLLEKEFPIVE